MHERFIKLIIESKIAHISLLSKAVQAICSEVVNDEILLYNIQLCLVEAATNAIKHAYHLKPGNFVEVAVTLDEHQVTIQIMDTGDQASLPAPDKDIEQNQDDFITLAESGRGLFLIHQIMDEVTLGQYEGKNVFTMRKRLDNTSKVPNKG